MEVILLEKIENLGSLGEIVNVRSGYARNFLVPQKKAKMATKANLEEFEKIRAELEAAAAEIQAAAEARKAEIDGTAVTITANAGPEGKLFGSVTVAEIADAVAEAGKTIERSEIRMPEGPIRSTGEYDVLVHLHSDVDATIKVTVETGDEVSSLEDEDESTEESSEEA